VLKTFPLAPAHSLAYRDENCQLEKLLVFVQYERSSLSYHRFFQYVLFVWSILLSPHARARLVLVATYFYVLPLLAFPSLVVLLSLLKRFHNYLHIRTTYQDLVQSSD